MALTLKRSVTIVRPTSTTVILDVDATEDTNQVEIAKISSVRFVKGTPVTRLMYYLSHVRKLLDLSQFINPVELYNLTDYNNADLTDADLAKLFILCTLLDPRKLLHKCIFFKNKEVNVADGSDDYASDEFEDETDSKTDSDTDDDTKDDDADTTSDSNTAHTDFQDVNESGIGNEEYKVRIISISNAKAELPFIPISKYISIRGSNTAKVLRIMILDKNETWIDKSYVEPFAVLACELEMEHMRELLCEEMERERRKSRLQKIISEKLPSGNLFRRCVIM